MPKPQAQDRIETTWSHKGVTIHFNPSFGNFWADAPGKKLSAPSLDAIKAKIDKLAVDTFEPFEAYVAFGGYGQPPPKLVVETFDNYSKDQHRGSSSLLKVRVVSLDKSEGDVVFRYEGGDEVKYRSSVSGLDHVYPLTAEARDLWRAEQVARFERDKIGHELDQKVMRCREKLQALQITARDWKPAASGGRAVR